MNFLFFCADNINPFFPEQRETPHSFLSLMRLLECHVSLDKGIYLSARGYLILRVAQLMRDAAAGTEDPATEWPVTRLAPPAGTACAAALAAGAGDGALLGASDVQ